MPTTITKYTSRSARTLYSTHGTWTTARNGTGLTLHTPNGLTGGVINAVTFWLYRAMMHFPQVDLPAAEDRELIKAYLYIYIYDRGSTLGVLQVTRGVHGEPIETSDWTGDTAKVVSGGELAYGDMVEGQYNAIPLNDTFLTWLDQDSAPEEEYEGFTVGGLGLRIFHDTVTPKYSRWSQSFTPDITHTVKKIKMWMKRVGNAGTITFDLYAADANHRPTGAVLATGTKAATAISDTTYTWYEVISLGTGIELTASSKYVIVVSASAGDEDNNYVLFHGKTGNPYSGGQTCLSTDQGVTWDYTTYATYDLAFVEYGAGYLDDDGNPITKGTLITLKGTPDMNGAEPPPGYDGGIGFYSPRYSVGSRAPYLYFEYCRDVYPTANLTRVTAIRHIYRPGLFRMEVTLGDVQNAVDMIDTKVRTEVGAPSYDAEWLDRLLKHIERFRVVPPKEERPPPYPPVTPLPPYYAGDQLVEQLPTTPLAPLPPYHAGDGLPSYLPPAPPPAPVPPIMPSPLDIFKEKMWGFVKDPLTQIRETWGRIKWWQSRGIILGLEALSLPDLNDQVLLHLRSQR